MSVTSAAEDKLRRDLAGFADPGTMVELSPENGRTAARWTEQGVSKSAEFELDDSQPTIAWGVNGAISYAGFLAGPEMGNLRAIARNALNLIDRIDPFVAPRAQVEGTLTEGGDAMDLLASAAMQAEDSTSLVFVAADAGVGKTSLLKTAVRREAERFLEGQTTTLWLYVDAQARRLAALEDALSAELGRLRARFAFDAIIPLVRTGSITLVIDGFDELIGSVGAYDEAFNGLADFIADLDGGGTVIAAARSTYYEQEFLDRVQRGLGEGDPWTLRPVRLKDWNAEQRAEYVAKAAEGLTSVERAQAVRTVEQALASDDVAEVAGKPFFVVRTTELVLQGWVPSTESGSLLNRLVGAYIDREVTKLLDSARQPLLTPAALRSFFDELTVEMWRQESRELTRSSVQEIAALIGEVEGLKEDDIREVAARAPSFAMLRVGSSAGSLAWEHDVYFAYFLSRPVALTVEARDPRQLSRLLKRGRLPEDAASMVGRLSRSIPVQDFIDLAVAAADEERIEQDRVRRNAGLLVAGRLAGEAVDDVVIHDLTIGDVALRSAVLRRAVLRNVEFTGTDLAGVAFIDCRSEGLAVYNRVLLSPASRLEINGVAPSAFFGLRFLDGDNEHTLYSPSEIRAQLRTVGLPSAAADIRTRNVSSDIGEYVARVCRFYSRSNVIVEGSDDTTSVIADTYWPIVRKALLDSGVAEVRTRSASGRKVFVERTVRADEIMLGQDPDAVVDSRVATFWRLLEEDLEG